MLRFTIALVAALPVIVVADDISVSIDPITRYCHVSYRVPDDAPNRIGVACEWSPASANQWQAARIRPLVSETALRLAQIDQRGQWALGRVTERNAAGLVRTVVFDPYPDAQRNGVVNIDFRVRLEGLVDYAIRIQADNSDVVYLEDWSGVFQKSLISTKPEDPDAPWHWRADSDGATFNNDLRGDKGPDHALPMLSYPLDLTGPHAIFVNAGSIELRLTGDERFDPVESDGGWESLWRWTRMDRQHLVISQRHNYSGWRPASIDYVKFVPLTRVQASHLNSQFDGPRDKFVAGFWEPYTWSFHNVMEQAVHHRQVLTAFSEARFSLVDCQVGRFGSKVEYESRIANQLLYETQGDKRADESIPTTDGVGRMQQFTNALDATIRYTHELGLDCHANFGAGAAYVGSVTEGDFARAHPEWMYQSQLRYEVPEVRAYVLSLIDEVLEIGTPGVSIDFMRYSFTIPDAEICNTFLRELRALADMHARKRKQPVPILVQFPGHGVLPPRQFRRGSYDLFDYQTWAAEGLVDYLCPSNDDERHLHLDVAPYLEAVRGTKTKVLPNVAAPGLKRPGMYLWRVQQLYDAGVAGIYIFQSDQCALGSPVDRRTARLLTSSEDVRNWWDEDARLRPQRSKGIYITRPSRPNRGWRPRERVRVWLEGIEMGEVEFLLNGEVVNHCDGPPYLLGTEERTSDRVIPPNRESELVVRAKDGDGWLERAFTLQGEIKKR